MDERPHTPSDDVWLPHEPGRPADHPAPQAGPGQPATWVTTPAAAAPSGGRGRRLLAGAALATGLAVGGAAVAAAVTSGDRAAQGERASAQAGGPESGFLPGADDNDGPGGQPGLEGFRGRGGHHGPGGRGFGGFGAALHGELVVPQQDGTGTRTIAVQSGTVSSVTSSRLSVRSTDGFTATYVVNSSTRLLPGSGGISAVKTDHQVVVVATKSGSNLTAIRVGDRTLRQQQRPDGGDRTPRSPSPSPSGSTSGAKGASA